MSQENMTIERDWALAQSELGPDQIKMGRSDQATRSSLPPIVSARPLRVMFAFTSMPVGGAEILVSNLIQRMDAARFVPEICCLKELGPLGEELAQRYPASSGFLKHKYDVRVLPRLIQRMRDRLDALVTVGAGDKMFWGRIAAKFSGVPVILSALHSTGWPDGIGRLNRLLTPWTDAFIAVAPEHGKYLVEQEKLPKEKVRVIPNGIDTDRFVFDATAPASVRRELGIPPAAPLCGIVAALRPEKNHRLFLQVAERIGAEIPETHFAIVGDGPEADGLRTLAAEQKLTDRVHFLGTRSDIPRLLSALTVFLLTSDNEANPVSILEALAVQVPVVATDVGSVSATVRNGLTGFLAEAGNAKQLADFSIELIRNGPLAHRLGVTGRQEVVAHSSLERMVRGYEQLILEIYQRKRSQPPAELSDGLNDSVEICGATP